MRKKIIISNKIYTQTDALKLLNLSKTHYYTLKENVGFELKHLSDNTLKSLKKELKQSLKAWKEARIETRKWLTKFNKKHGLTISTAKLKKAISEHNKHLTSYRSDGFSLRDVQFPPPLKQQKTRFNNIN